MRRAFQYFDKYLADEVGSNKTDNEGYGFEWSSSSWPQYVLYFTIRRLTLEKQDDEEMRKLHDMAEMAIKDYSNPPVPNSRFMSPMEAAAGSAVEARSVGVIRRASGYLPQDDKYFVKESQ
ncbi:hypothetical protein BWQ96_03189 [Gracilariopsis chorda]|uniref:Uncharacterized protein n=1 Tax=Gracilariopsis chorda TaxID=448386 RepID=A0A2V3IY14_9FLOR|nr:hypothetical protein BWQ96_03189 [Gracilariopsis chorda]|eukprot:PXF46999.1 hypothetical protein BWQ96_03189 [Gracilariopsis chorda]